MNYKKFSLVFIISCIFFVILNAFIYNFFTKEILTYKTHDLSRMGYLTSLASTLQAEERNLPRKQMYLDDINDNPVDLLVIGDSFAGGLGGGVNPFFQDFIATYNNLNVVTIGAFEQYNFIDLLIILINSGWIEKYKPRYVLIESVGRNTVKRFSRNFDFTQSAPVEEIISFYKLPPATGTLPKSFFINTGNLKFLLYNFLYLFSENAFISDVHKFRLSKPLFSVSDGKDLLVIRKALNKFKKYTPENISLLNSNLNIISNMLQEKNTKLYFMPIVDKFDLYSEFIEDNPHPKNKFFLLLRPLDKKYSFIDTKVLLLESINDGVKDVFHPDDTHWSWRASEKIFKVIKFTGGKEQPPINLNDFK